MPIDPNVINSIGPALAGIKSLTDLVSTIKDSKIRIELNNKIGALLDLQQQYETLVKENAELKRLSEPREKPTLKFGCYQFERQGLFCPACYDSKDKKFRASRMRGQLLFVIL